MHTNSKRATVDRARCQTQQQHRRRGRNRPDAIGTNCPVPKALKTQSYCSLGREGMTLRYQCFTRPAQCGRGRPPARVMRPPQGVHITRAPIS